MDRTPTPSKRYEILPIEGNAYQIERRGIAIESLGDEMKAAADLLDRINLGAECRGKSLDAIKDRVGDMTGDLRKAGERYAPSGTALLTYGRALDSVQATVNALMPELEEAWGIYTGVQQNFAADAMLPEPEEGEPDNRTTAHEVESARDEWESLAVRYEGAYDTWWSAYEDARTGIKDANDDGVKDSRWDDLLPALEVLGDILSYAGLVLAVLACVFAGPFILIAAIVGVAALAIACVKVANGRGTWVDIAIAAVGVFPFGKAFAAASAVRGATGVGGRLLAGGRGLIDMGGEMVGVGWRNGTKLSAVLAQGRGAQVFHDAAGTLVNRNGTRVLRGFFGDLGPASLGSRLLRGSDGAMQGVISDAASGLSNKALDNLSMFLGSTRNGSVMQDMLGPGNAALDFVDNLGKAGAGFAYDRATGGWSVG